MTETPNGQHDALRTDIPSSPLPGRPAYAGSEWRRPDAPAAPPVGAAEPAQPAAFGSADNTGGTAAGADRSSGFGGAAYGAEHAGGFRGAGDGAAVDAGGPRPTPGGDAGGPGTTPGGDAGGAGPTPGGDAGSAGPTPGGVDNRDGTGLPWEQRGSAPTGSGQYGGQPHGFASPAYGPPPGGTPPTTGYTWPYAAPEPSRPRAGRRLVAVSALTAVLGGLAGGGLVAALDRDSTTAGAITIQGSSAPAAANQSGTAEAAAATAMKSVVTLSVRGVQEAGTGSGVVIRSDGYVLTNEHVTAVADGGGSITVAFSDGRTASARLVGADKKTDLAVVKVNLTGLTAATFADSDAVKVGQTVVAVGSPLGLNGTVTEGIVSALHRPTSGASDNSAVIDAIQTDAAINPGNSGGALVDLAGRVVGINQSIATAGSNSGGFGQQSEPGNIGIGFAIPSDTAARISQELISTGKATHALLGVQTETATSNDQLTAVGATIASVTPGEAAAAAGLKAGDVVIKVDDRVIGQSTDLAATIRSYAPGTKVTLTVKRGNDTRTITVTLGSDAGK